ncbi:MAG: cytochrome C [Campylobacterota bacterium]|nr:cytochrome C [Campylobacterota bacterium]
MKILNALLIGSLLVGGSLYADAKSGQKYYLKKLKKCKKDGFKNGGAFAASKSRDDWEILKEDGELLNEWKTICPTGAKRFDKMKKKNVNDLYDFVHKYASDGEVPSCG